MKSKKGPSTSPFLLLSILHSIFAIILYTTTQNYCIITKTAYTNTETLIRTRKLIGSFRVRIRVLPDSTEVSVRVSEFP